MFRYTPARRLMDMILLLIPSATAFVIPCVQKVTMQFQVASLRNERRILLFIFLPPIFLPSFPTAGIGRRVGKKMRGKKIEDIFGYLNLRLSISYLRLRAFESVLLRSLLNGTPRRYDREGNLGTRLFAGGSCFSFFCPPFFCPRFLLQELEGGLAKR